EEPGQKPAERSPRGFLAGFKKITDTVSLVTSGIGALTAAVVKLNADRHQWVFWLGLSVFLLSGAWFLCNRWWRRRHRQKLTFPQVAPSPGAYLRGLLPFEKGETLLGRATELRQIVAKVTS